LQTRANKTSNIREKCENEECSALITAAARDYITSVAVLAAAAVKVASWHNGINGEGVLCGMRKWRTNRQATGDGLAAVPDKRCYASSSKDLRQQNIGLWPTELVGDKW